MIKKSLDAKDSFLLDPFLPVCHVTYSLFVHRDIKKNIILWPTSYYTMRCADQNYSRFETQTVVPQTKKITGG